MRSRLGIVLAVTGVVVGFASTVMAHHSFSAEYDVEKPVMLKGTVTRMDWINPHSWIHLDVKKPDGAIDNWMIEVGAPNAMFRRGFNKNSLPVGTEIVVDGYQARDNTLKANGKVVTFLDGRRLFVSGDEKEK
jgi:hypothetical protein